MAKILGLVVKYCRGLENHNEGPEDITEEIMSYLLEHLGLTDGRELQPFVFVRVNGDVLTVPYVGGRAYATEQVTQTS